MIKVIIQIPCWNEEKTLPLTIKDLPKEIAGVDCIETLAIDDGSDDRTVEVARASGVDHIVQLGSHRGLARAFMIGLDSCLRLGADIIVNTDADNQYHGSDIEKLIRPLLEGRADIVVGDRGTDTIEHFSWLKKRLQKIGSWIVKILSGLKVSDATSGFRAFSRDAALKINIISKFTYTLETLIQAGQKRMRVDFVEIRTNKKVRESRLIPNIPFYLFKSAVTMFRIFAYYQPLKVFFTGGLIIFGAGLVLGLRYLYFQFFGPAGDEHFASLFLCLGFIISGFVLFMMGVLGDQIATNRHLIEDILYRTKKNEYKKS